jgi:ABC-2 type transport system ATP-binding protein
MQTNPVIEIRNVYKSFKNIQAVIGLTAEVYPGEYVALLGPNGAGKTTLIEMIEGLQLPDSGEIRILGKKWKGNESELHAVIGLSLQETNFIDKLTVEETLRLFASFYHLANSKVEEILEKVNLGSKRKNYVVNLSGGQKQRLALGIALLNDPKILLLDEPTTGLDPTARREIWNILEALKKDQGTSMILTTHYMEEAEYLCERIFIMDKGTIIAKGTLNELVQSYGEGDVIDFTLSAPSAFMIDEHVIHGLKKIIWDIENKKGKLIVQDLAHGLTDFINFTSAHHLKISDLESRKMTLDDLFIHMTGRKLDE